MSESYPITFGWQANNPQTNFLPTPANGPGTQSSKVVNGIATGTNTIYTNIIPISRIDNTGIEVAWTGNPVGTLSVIVSCSGNNWSALTFTFQQPAGSAGNMYLNLTDLGGGFLMLAYTNTSGSGTISAYARNKGGV